MKHIHNDLSVVLIQIDGTEVLEFEVPDYPINTRSLDMIFYDGDMNDESVVISVNVTELITGNLHGCRRFIYRCQLELIDTDFGLYIINILLTCARTQLLMLLIFQVSHMEVPKRCHLQNKDINFPLMTIPEYWGPLQTSLSG